VTYFAAQWEKRHGSKYPHDDRRQRDAATAVLKAVSGDLDQAKQIVDSFLEDGDRFLEGKHHLPMLKTQMTRYLERGRVSRAWERPLVSTL
jgi:hypothetical protein